jgi:hypothetical protein
MKHLLLSVVFLAFGLPLQAARSPLFQYDGEYQGRVVIVTVEQGSSQRVRKTVRIPSAEFKATPNVVQGGLELIAGGVREHLSFRGTAFQFKRSTINESVTIDGSVRVRPFSVAYSASTSGGYYPSAAGFIEYLHGRARGDIKVVVTYSTGTQNEVRTYFLSPIPQ